MPRVDFVIGNPGHHLAAAQPVAEQLSRHRGIACRLLSLCELRGFVTPTRELRDAGIDTRPIVPFRFRSPSSLGQTGGGGGIGRRRAALHSLSWQLLLRPRLAALLRQRPDLVVLPNDAAFPYDRLARELRGRGLPFLLLQEGIRFPLPGETNGNGSYGGGGAVAVAAWGESSAEYFRAQGVSAERIFLTGSPRLERDLARDWRPETAALRRRLGIAGDALLYFSNPIDDQGYCTTAEKLELFRRLLEQLEPLLAAGHTPLVVKLHGRESEAAFRAVAQSSPAPAAIVIVKEAALHALLHLARAAIILSSTVGLEALARGVPLGVLEIPGFGFAADYVSSGAARGLTWSRPLAPQVEKLLRTARTADGAARYLRRRVAMTEGACDELTRLIERLVR